jgi:hypothetical protein
MPSVQCKGRQKQTPKNRKEASAKKNTHAHNTFTTQIMTKQTLKNRKEASAKKKHNPNKI